MPKDTAQPNAARGVGMWAVDSAREMMMAVLNALPDGEHKELVTEWHEATLNRK